MSLHSITNGGLLAEWQHNDGSVHHIAAIAFSAGKKELCALASAQGITVCAVPWLRVKGSIVSQYVCYEVCVSRISGSIVRLCSLWHPGSCVGLAAECNVCCRDMCVFAAGYIVVLIYGAHSCNMALQLSCVCHSTRLKQL